MPPPGQARHPRRPAVLVGVLHLGWFPPTVSCASSTTRGSGLSVAQRGALRLLDGGEFHQVSHLAEKVPLGRILQLWQRLQEDRGCCDVLARTEPWRELHAGVVDDIVVDPECAPTRGTRGVHTFRPRGGPQRLVPGWGRLSAMTEVFVVSLRVGERSLALVRWGVRLLGRHHLRRRVTVGHGAHVRWRGCALQAVVPCARGITQEILKAQEVVGQSQGSSPSCPRTATRAGFLRWP